MNKKTSILTFLLILFYQLVFSQIDVTIENSKDEFVLLTQFRSGKNYIIDTLTVRKDKIKIPTSNLHSNEIYAVTLPTLNYERINFIYEGNDFDLNTTYEDLLGHVHVSDNINTQILYKDLQQNLPLLNELIKIQSKENISVQDSLLGQIRKNRAIILAEFPTSLYAKLNLIDQGAKLPFYDNRKFAGSNEQFSDYYGGMADFIKDIPVDNDLVLTNNLFERRVSYLINHPDNFNNDSMIIYMDSLLTTVSNNQNIYEFVLQLYYNKFNTLEDHEIEKAMIHFWNSYLKDKDVSTIDVLEKWKFGKLIHLRANTQIGEKFHDFEVRDENFNRVRLDEMEGEMRILVFWNPAWQSHWIHIAYWRDDFNVSGMYNEGFRLFFIGVKNDEYQWFRATEKLQITDKPNYLNRLNDPIFETFFDSDLKIEFPLTYLIDKDGIVLDKFKPDIIDYSEHTP